MNRGLHAVFKQEDEIVAVTRACRERGYEIIDACTPYPVHGIERAMGSSRRGFPSPAWSSACSARR
ncbi:MAG: DUF3341 domain-containing protein [bacterium]|nr:DUF3341 domain-containing protein [bacterium]